MLSLTLYYKMKNNPLLTYFSRYTNLTTDEEELILKSSVVRSFSKDQYISQQGATATSIFFILTGCTKTFYVDTKGQEHIVSFSIENWWTSDLGSFITQSSSDYNVQCLESTKLIEFTYGNLENLYIKIPKLERIFRKIVERAYVASQKRIIQGFSLTAKERYIIFNESYPHINQRVPQYMVASYLGITKEFLSKIKSDIAKSL